MNRDFENTLGLDFCSLCLGRISELHDQTPGTVWLKDHEEDVNMKMENCLFSSFIQSVDIEFQNEGLCPCFLQHPQQSPKKPFWKHQKVSVILIFM